MPNNHAERQNALHGFAFTQETVRYHRDLVDEFEKRFENEIIRADTTEFDNGMPLVLVGSAKRALYLTWMPEDTFASAFTNMCFVGAGFTENPDAAGANVEHLGIFAPFFDARMEKRGRKDMPDGTGRAIIRSQTATVPPLARAMRYVAGAEFLATLNIHSHLAAQTFERYGIEVINLTAARPFAEKIKEIPVTPGRRRVVVTTDAGDFNHAIPFLNQIGAELAVVQKVRNPEGEGKNNKVTAQIIYGDVRDSDVFILDDSISGASTVREATEVLHEAASITYCATHPVFVGDYYERLEGALENPLVSRIMITDSLPTKYRLNQASIPYGQLSDGSFKEIDIVPIGKFLADSAYTILHASSTAEAKTQLGDDVWDMKRPEDLYHDMTGMDYPIVEDTGVYLGRKRIVTLYEYNQGK